MALACEASLCTHSSPVCPPGNSLEFPDGIHWLFLAHRARQVPLRMFVRQAAHEHLLLRVLIVDISWQLSLRQRKTARDLGNVLPILVHVYGLGFCILRRSHRSCRLVWDSAVYRRKTGLEGYRLVPTNTRQEEHKHADAPRQVYRRHAR